MLEPEIIKRGDDSGNRTLIKYTSDTGAVIKAIGVPQSWETTLGPTWCYVIEGDDLTLVDPGCFGSVSYLEEGLGLLGHSLTDIDRIVISHGHLDHDGSCPPVVRKSGAELWAHEIYGSMLRIDRWEMEMGWRREVQGFRSFESSGTVMSLSLAETVEAYEKDLVLDALKTTRGNRVKAAKLLHSTERIITYKVKKYGIDGQRFRR